MITIVYAVMLLLAMLVIAYCLMGINVIDKQIDKILAEEKRQNKRIDIMEKREQMRQAEERRDKACIEAKNLFKEW